MRRVVCTVFLILTVFFSGAQEQTGRRFAVVDLSSNFMREEPAYEAENGNQALMGTIVEIVGEKDYWRQIISPDPYKAWVNEMGLVEMNEQELQAYISSPKYICTAEHTHIYVSPDITSLRISDLVMGGLVRQVTSSDNGQAGNDGGRTGRSGKGELGGKEKGKAAGLETGRKREGKDAGLETGDNREGRAAGREIGGNREGRGVSRGGFFEVMLPSGTRGWVPKGDVEDFSTWTAHHTTASDITGGALFFLGVPYMWGGATIEHFDCSGLTRFIFYMNGILIPRNASQQAKVGEDVSLDALKPADLLFFGKAATEDSPERISHVGIYLGEGLYIHSSQKVRISSLDSSSEDYGGRMPIRARRILGHVNDGTGIISIAKSPHYFIQSE